MLKLGMKNLSQEKENLQLKLQGLKQVGYESFLKKLKIIQKLFVKLMIVEKYLFGVVLQVQ
jgi:hypothetical protein